MKKACQCSPNIGISDNLFRKKGGKMDAKELYIFIENYYGYKVNMRYINSETMEVGAILYDSFYIKCFLKHDEKIFNAGISYGESESLITEFLGKKCLTGCDKQSIKASLQIIDDYCRLRLPDKFLEAYYQAYALS